MEGSLGKLIEGAGILSQIRPLEGSLGQSIAGAGTLSQIRPLDGADFGATGESGGVNTSVPPGALFSIEPSKIEGSEMDFSSVNPGNQASPAPFLVTILDATGVPDLYSELQCWFRIIDPAQPTSGVSPPAFPGKLYMYPQSPRTVILSYPHTFTLMSFYPGN